MAAGVQGFGIGGQTLAERTLGWNRRTIRKGMQELLRGEPIVDGEAKLPKLLEEMRTIVDPQTQTDPSFKSTRLYTRISAAEVRRQLIAQKGYAEEELPSTETLRCRLNEMGHSVKRVVKAKPQKHIPETEAIFAASGESTSGR